MRCSIRWGRRTDAYFILGDLRQSDREELISASGKPPDKGLCLAWGNSKNYRKAVLVKGEVVALFGVANGKIPWFLGSDGTPKRVFMEFGKKEVQSMLNRFESLANWVSGKNVGTLHWLSYCGFEFVGQETSHFTKDVFYNFSIERKKCAG